MSRNPEQLSTLPFFKDRFGGKDCILCQDNPSAEEVGGLEITLYEAAQNFKEVLRQENQGLKVYPVDGSPVFSMTGTYF
jgi:hypothetical protein